MAVSCSSGVARVKRFCGVSGAGGAILGTFLCVSTSSTPGSCSAAAVSMSRTRPAATVLPSATPYTNPG